MKKEERRTKQKKIIEKYLKSTRSHPSAETVYLNVRKKLPTISKGTVYRILKNLKDKKRIQEIPTDISRWDYNEKPHPHFVCNCCGCIFDVDEKIEISISDNLQSGEVENYRIVFTGACKNCDKVKK